MTQQAQGGRPREPAVLVQSVDRALDVGVAERLLAGAADVSRRRGHLP